MFLSGFFSSKSVKITLRSLLCPPIVVIIFPFDEQIIDHPDGEQIKISEIKPDLHTSEKEQRCCHRAVNWARFFFDSAIDSTLSPHSSKSCGRIS